MAHVEGKVTSFQVINSALNDPGRVNRNESQSLAIATFKLFCEQPDNVSMSFNMFKTLQKLPEELRNQLPPQVKAEYAKFEKTAAGATSAMFTMSAPRAMSAAPVASHPMKDQLAAKIEEVKNGSPRNGSPRSGQ
jgi:hypothetical protein